VAIFSLPDFTFALEGGGAGRREGLGNSLSSLVSGKRSAKTVGRLDGSFVPRGTKKVTKPFGTNIVDVLKRGPIENTGSNL